MKKPNQGQPKLTPRIMQELYPTLIWSLHTIRLLAGILTLTNSISSSHFILKKQWHFEIDLPVNTAADTVPDFNRIPFYSTNGTTNRLQIYMNLTTKSHTHLNRFYFCPIISLFQKFKIKLKNFLIY